MMEESSSSSSSRRSSTSIHDDEEKKKLNIPKVFEMYLKKLDELEENYNERIRRKRQRALCLLDVVPSYRQSHVRLFVSSKYTLNNRIVVSLQGRPLVGPSFEKTSAAILDHPADQSTNDKKEDGDKTAEVSLNPMSIPQLWNASKYRMTDASGINNSTLQEDEAKFTNLWARIQICFQQNQEEVTTYEWKQSKLPGQQGESQDQFAFDASFPSNQNKPAVTTLCLYKEPTDNKHYIPTESLCQVLFPNMASSLRHWNNHFTKLKPSKIQRNDLDNHENLFLPPHDYEQIPLENDILILPMITITEVLKVLHQYVKGHNLIDENDWSLFHLDEKLQNLFGKDQPKTMRLHELRRNVLQKGLLFDKQTHEPHIIIIHTILAKQKPSSENVSNTKTDNGIAIDRKRKRNNATSNIHPIKQDPQQQHHHEDSDVVWYDIDFEVPNLFHARTRDVLRRIKKRELEYTSSRTKAMAWYRNDHKLFKTRLEEAIGNQNSYSKHHIPIHNALAKACPPGSEAQVSSQIDARMSYLIDALQKSTQKLVNYHKILHACQKYSTLKNQTTST